MRVLAGVFLADIPPSVDTEKRQVEMTFRSGESSRSAQSGLKLSDLIVGSKVDGTVKKIEDYGLFIEIEGSKLRGLCHKSEVYFFVSTASSISNNHAAFRQQRGRCCYGFTQLQRG